MSVRYHHIIEQFNEARWQVGKFISNDRRSLSDLPSGSIREHITAMHQMIVAVPEKYRPVYMNKEIVDKYLSAMIHSDGQLIFMSQHRAITLKDQFLTTWALGPDRKMTATNTKRYYLRTTSNLNEAFARVSLDEITLTIQQRQLCIEKQALPPFTLIEVRDYIHKILILLAEHSFLVDYFDERTFTTESSDYTLSMRRVDESGGVFVTLEKDQSIQIEDSMDLKDQKTVRSILKHLS